MRKKIVITGGLGFIGCNLAARLIEQGHYVCLIDDLSTGRPSNIERIKKSLRNKKVFTNFYFQIADICDGLGVVDQMVDPRVVDEVYHLACPASPPKYYLDPLKTLDINYIGTKNVMEFAKKYGAKVLFSSTSEIYGDPKVHPQKEAYTGNVDPLSPRSVYDEGKRVAETLVAEYGRQGVDTRIVRISNTYGPYMDPNDGRVVTNFIKQALRGDPITIYGDGSQTRSLCYIDDNIDGLLTIMETERFRNEAVNVGNGEEITMNELARKIRMMTDSESKFVYQTLPVSDPQRRKLDTTKLRFAGWEPKISTNEGLQKTISYMKEEI